MSVFCCLRSGARRISPVLLVLSVCGCSVFQGGGSSSDVMAPARYQDEFENYVVVAENMLAAKGWPLKFRGPWSFRVTATQPDGAVTVLGQRGGAVAFVQGRWVAAYTRPATRHTTFFCFPDGVLMDWVKVHEFVRVVLASNGIETREEQEPYMQALGV